MRSCSVFTWNQKAYLFHVNAFARIIRPCQQKHARTWSPRNFGCPILNVVSFRRFQNRWATMEISIIRHKGRDNKFLKWMTEAGKSVWTSISWRSMMLPAVFDSNDVLPAHSRSRESVDASSLCHGKITGKCYLSSKYQVYMLFPGLPV